MSRSFLFLQGVASPFFAELGKALLAQGHRVLKINFCGGDWFYSRALNALNYRGDIEGLAGYLGAIVAQHAINDMVLFGDTRPVHLDAIKLAGMLNINIHVFEEGYLRPGWITLEQGGVNAHSSLSKNPQWYQRFAGTLKTTPATRHTGKQLPPRALHDMRYHLGSFLLRRFFPRYRSHRPDTPLTEYLGWIRRFPKIWLFHKKQAQRAIHTLLQQHQSFFVLPLQLSADAQIKQHSGFASMRDVIQHCIQSFACHAPVASTLVIKNHPLDTALADYPGVINDAIQKNNIAPQRVVYLETGDLNALLDQASGTVLVNSTVGLSSLQAGCPTIALGTAIYDMPGLTYQGKLDDFWQDALKKEHRPDARLVDAFCQSVIALTQINGDFYTKKGIKLAVSGSVERLAALPSHASQSHPDSFSQQVFNKA